MPKIASKSWQKHPLGGRKGIRKRVLPPRIAMQQPEDRLARLVTASFKQRKPLYTKMGFLKNQKLKEIIILLEKNSLGPKFARLLEEPKVAQQLRKMLLGRGIVKPFLDCLSSTPAAHISSSLQYAGYIRFGEALNVAGGARVGEVLNHAGGVVVGLVLRRAGGVVVGDALRIGGSDEFGNALNSAGDVIVSRALRRAGGARVGKVLSHAGGFSFGEALMQNFEITIAKIKTGTLI